MTLRLGSRGSRLALWQANHVREQMDTGDVSIEIHTIRTTGDRVTDVPLARIGDTGLFTKEIDRALLEGGIDAAVHSLKDVPTQLPEGLALAAVLRREDPRDALLFAPGRARTLGDLPEGARIGTSSLRRRALLLALRPDLVVADLRGNLDTRMTRLSEGAFDALILALAGVRRLGWESSVGDVLGPPDWLPAAGQGALAVVARADDAETRTIVAVLDHQPTRIATTAERSFLRSLQGGCQVPIGTLAELDGDSLSLHGFVANEDGTGAVRAVISGPATDAEQLGRDLAAQLLRQGAAPILERLRAAARERWPLPSPP